MKIGIFCVLPIIGANSFWKKVHFDWYSTLARERLSLCLFVSLLMLLNRLTHILVTSRSSRQEVFCEQVVLKLIAQFTGVFLYFARGSATFLKKTPAQVFSCDFCEMFKNTVFEEHFCAIASAQKK